MMPQRTSCRAPSPLSQWACRWALPRYASSVQLFLFALSAALKLTPARQPNFALVRWPWSNRVESGGVPAKVIARPTALDKRVFR